jgi:hypothetical protein
VKIPENPSNNNAWLYGDTHSDEIEAAIARQEAA